MTKRPSDEYKISELAEMAVTLPPIDQHPGLFLKSVILPAWGATNVSELARRLGVERRGLIKILDGDRIITREMAYRFGALMNDHVADLLIAYQHAWDLQDEQDLRQRFRDTIERLPARAEA